MKTKQLERIIRERATVSGTSSLLELSNDRAHEVARLGGRRGALAPDVGRVVHGVGEHPLQSARETIGVRVVANVAAQRRSRILI